MGAHRGDDYGRKDDNGSGKPIVAVPCLVQLTDLMGSLRYHEYREGKREHRHSAVPGEEHAEAHERCPLVVVAGKFRHQSGAWDFIKADERPHDDCHDEEIEKE